MLPATFIKMALIESLKLFWN